MRTRRSGPAWLETLVNNDWLALLAAGTVITCVVALCMTAYQIARLFAPEGK